MATPYDQIPDRRAIVRRRALEEALAALVEEMRADRSRLAGACNPQLQAIAAHLGEVLWSVGQHDQATTIWKEGAGLNPQNETLRETMRRLRGAP